MNFRWLVPILAFLAFAPGLHEAEAQLLFAGGEDIDFTCSGSGQCGVTTNPTAFRSAWAREAYEVNGSNQDPPLNRFATPVFSANATLWVHAQYCNEWSGCGGGGTNSTAANYQMLRLFDTAGNPTLVFMGTGGAGQLAIESRTPLGAFTTLVTCSSAFNASLTQIDIYINYGVNGEVALYNNSQKVCDFTGNVTNGDGATTLNQVEFSAPFWGGFGAWSEVIVATTDTRAMARFTANTVGDGNTIGFSGTNICSSIWSALSFNDVNFGYSGSPNVLHECTVNGSLPPGEFNVVGLVMSARALIGATGPQHFEFITRVGGADHPSPNFAPTPSFSNIQNYIQTANPSTGAAWATTDFATSGFNVGEETTP